MQRALIAIGCNSYNCISPLTGAELDAQRIYDKLIRDEIGNYHPSTSQLLLSPTLDEVRLALKSILFSNEKLDTFTFFFAGHGIVDKAGFYFCLKDTRLDQLPVTSLWLSELFTNIASSAPSQSNIILDACYSGGLTVDLGVLAKAEITGNANSPAITLLAMSARDQEASETDAGGLGTNALLDCISGSVFVQDTTAALDLMDIGPAVANRLKNAPDQSPCFTAISIRQRSIFCRNPHYEAKAERTFEKWQPRRFMDAIEPALESCSDSASDLISNVQRLTSGLVSSAKDTADRFRKAEVLAVSVSALLRYCQTHPSVDLHVLEEVGSVINEIEDTLNELTNAIASDQYALLGNKTGLGELYALPIRISKIIGWLGAAFHLREILGQPELFPVEKFREVLEHIGQQYAPSVVLLNDTQAPYIALGLSAASRLGLRSEGETILSLLFNSALDAKGLIANAHLKPNQILKYLTARQTADYSDAADILARPTEAIAVLLRCAKPFDLVDVFDESLEDLDHLSISAYVAEDYTKFALQHIEGGENATFTIGHGIWSIADLDSAWPDSANVRPMNSAVAAGAICSALIFPDRVPWFLLSSRHE
ncbi:MAG: caspase family protein [Parvibaculum sp.]|uniref:caspase family protein n=1 Tax=Parvibaculum sp. TaxID=2024848 RepID=UPI00271621AF|nr:caspase family protein [Parvibaculum sp.]MDO8837910.1 caspase family protein [Parvibaculum sp.]